MWPDRDRVAELIVTHAHGRSRGSGYRINATQVLTAAHVVENVESVLVRFLPDLPSEQTVTALSWQADPVTDIAYIEIPPQSGEDVQLGRVGTQAAVLQAQAVGFPLWKMRDGQYRDSHHAVGTVAVLSNFREGTLEFVVPSPPAPGEGGSPWEGMSGAALWVDGRIVGVVSKHHASDGLGRLAVAPLAGDFPDVVTAPGRYDALLADIAPDELLDRSHELAELVSFCAGDKPYMWWQAGPWAGKTALLSWFASHPPDGVDVISFFITAGQSDSGTFLESMIEQLGETAAPNRANMARLLIAAAERSAADGRRLLLVVDGLDEDTSRQVTGRPSIASLLPRRVRASIRVLVASRPNPQLPDDVPGDHPLRAVNARHLEASSRARHIEIAARNELSQLLQGEPLHRELLGLITASGSGLTVPDLEELTSRPRYELDRAFGSAFARSLTNRQEAFVFAHKTLRDTAENQYGTSLAGFRNRLHGWAMSYQDRKWPSETPRYLLFDYVELLVAQGDVQRLTKLGTDRARHVRMYHRTGADSYSMAQIDTMAGLLAAAVPPNLTDLVLLAFARKQLDDQNANIPVELPAVWAVLGELSRAVALIRSIPELHIRASALIHVMAAVAVPADVMRLAETTTYAIPARAPRAKALSELATAAARAGDLKARLAHTEAALEVIRALDSDSSYAHDPVCAELAKAAQTAGDNYTAMDSALRCTEPGRRIEALTAVAMVAILAGDRAGAQKSARRAATLIVQGAGPAWERERAVGRLAAIGHHDPEILRILGSLSHPADYDQSTERRAFAGAMAELALATGKQLLEAITREALAMSFPDDLVRASLLSKLALAAARIGDQDRYRLLAPEAQSALRADWPLWDRTLVVAGFAMTAAVAGDEDRARELIALVLNVARSLSGELFAQYRDQLAVALVVSGEDIRAEQIATMHADEDGGARLLADLAMRVARSGDLDRARELVCAAQGAVQVDRSFGLFCEITKVAAAIGDTAWCQDLFGKAEETMHWEHPVYALAMLAAAAAHCGDWRKVMDLVGRVLDMAEIAPQRAHMPTALKPIVEALILVGDFAGAERVAQRPDVEGEAMPLLVSGLLAAGQVERAGQFAHDISEEHYRAIALGEVAAAVSDPSRAMQLAESAESTARGLDNAGLRDLALCRLAAALSTARHLDDITRRLVVEVINTRFWASALPAVARLDPAAVRALADEVLNRRG